ncbi:lysophospholipid acyltransferase family protein [Thiomicrorhabdus aquaedulcis]|uniref:lysophospholipid acyltransferase family protein n=1 Tax=Thiomicrorhabdus aquaedulcis TaxID=2211106 RepID=UPI001E284C88|nr:hypothetical protein [Thiomicrorhabdus aquaedulcis]
MKIIWFMRSVLFALGQGVSLVLFSVLGQLTRPFSFATRYQFMHYWAKFCLFWLRITCGVRYEVHGAEHIQTEQAGLILARHESAWETLAFQAIFPRHAYVLKKSCLRFLFLAGVWHCLIPLPLTVERVVKR